MSAAKNKKTIKAAIFIITCVFYVFYKDNKNQIIMSGKIFYTSFSILEESSLIKINNRIVNDHSDEPP